MQSIFSMQYFNTGIIVILSVANLNVSYGLKEIDGYYADFTTEWYEVIGPIII